MPDNPLKLPLEYTPLSHQTVEAGRTFPPIQFNVTPESHEKSRLLLEGADLDGRTQIKMPYLFPSEMWAAARVVSQHYGRLNEVILTSSRWAIKGPALSHEPLEACTTIKAKTVLNDLPFLTVSTTTSNLGGQVLMECVDSLLLLHDAPHHFYHERARRGSTATPREYDHRLKVYFRYEWDPKIWNNNIHIDAYAQRFGYERALPEGVLYRDWAFLALLDLVGARAYTYTLDVKAVMPVYRDEEIRIIAEQINEDITIRFIRQRDQQQRFFALATPSSLA